MRLIRGASSFRTGAATGATRRCAAQNHECVCSKGPADCRSTTGCSCSCEALATEGFVYSGGRSGATGSTRVCRAADDHHACACRTSPGDCRRNQGDCPCTCSSLASGLRSLNIGGDGATGSTRACKARHSHRCICLSSIADCRSTECECQCRMLALNRSLSTQSCRFKGPHQCICSTRPKECRATNCPCRCETLALSSLLGHRDYGTREFPSTDQCNSQHHVCVCKHVYGNVFRGGRAPVCRASAHIT